MTDLMKFFAAFGAVVIPFCLFLVWAIRRDLLLRQMKSCALKERERK